MHQQNVIKEIHTAVINNDIEDLMIKTAAPVPRILASSKDVNGLTPLHKAAGLNHLNIMEYLMDIWPSATAATDATGKTPLHWSGSLEAFNKLVQGGADEQACDYVSNRLSPIFEEYVTSTYIVESFECCFNRWTAESKFV